MPNVQITQLPTAGPIVGTESVPIVQNGQTVQTTTAAIAAGPAQFQTFLTLNNEPTLANSRYLSSGAGLGLVDGGAQSSLQITLNGASGSLESASNGIIAKTDYSTVVSRTLTASGAGLSITNGDGVSGNPTFALTGLVGALATMPTPGLVAVRDSSTVAAATITGTSNQITVTNGNAFSGNPTIAIASDPVLPGTGAVTIPVGTTAQQPLGSSGQMRYDSTMDAFYGYSAGQWRQFSLTGGVTLVNTGTGLTGGPITGAGTISISDTGVTAATYGSATQSAQIAVNAQGQVTSASNVTITPSGIGAVASVSGTANEITATGTTNVTLSLPNALTFTGKTVTGGTFNMTAATVGSDTVATLTDSQTLTNKTISGSSNTLSNIGNSSLTNSSVTYNGVTVSLGGSGTITANTTNDLTFNNSGTGDASGTIFNGSAAKTISYNTLGASPLAGSTSLTTVGTITTGVWNGTAITNSYLANSSVTYNGVTVALGASGTITASTTAALTAGTGLQLNSGTTFDGSTAKTISIDSTVVTLDGSQTLTNKTLTIPVIAQISNTGTLTLPTSTDTLVGRDTTDTLTNKSISGSTNTFTNIPNSALTNSSVTIGTTSISLGGTSLTLGGLTSVAVTQDPTTDLQLATKQYVDNMVSTGLAYHQPVQVATTQSLAAQTGGTVTYNNGVGGVGATITLSVALNTLDGYSLANTNRILVKDEVNQAYNGVYTWATGGTVLTRSTDTNSYGPGTNQLSEGDYFFVQNGSVNKGNSYVCSTIGTITFGTTAITFSQFSTSQVYTAGTGLTLTNTTFSITNTGVTAAAYGSASSVGTFTVNAQGQLTAAGSTSIAIGASQVTSGTLAVAQGGTNIASYTTGDLLYASGATTLSKLGIGTSTYILTSSGSAPQWSAPSGITVGTATNAVNVGITANSTNATNYLTFVSATTGNLPELVNSGITCNPSTGQITGGIAGGSF